MPNQDTSTNDDDKEIIDDAAVENEDDTSEDESSTDDDDQNDDAEDTEDSEDDSDDDSDEDDSDNDDSEDEDEDDDKFSKRFSQIKGDSPEEYQTNLEEAYAKSSKEGKRLAAQLKEVTGRVDSIMAAVAKDPKLAKAIQDATAEGATPATVDPALAYAREQMEKNMETDYNHFVESHPELESDETLQEKVLAELKDIGDFYRTKGKTISMKEGLERAWRNLGLDKEDDKEKTVTKAKETASKSKTASTNKKSGGKKPGKSLTEEQIAVGKKMGLSEKQMLAYYSK